jgi:hypothetical protein
VPEYKQALAYPLLGYHILKNPEQSNIVAIAFDTEADRQCSPLHARSLKSLQKRFGDTLHKCRGRKIRTECVSFSLQSSRVLSPYRCLPGKPEELVAANASMRSVRLLSRHRLRNAQMRFGEYFNAIHALHRGRAG